VSGKCYNSLICSMLPALFRCIQFVQEPTNALRFMNVILLRSKHFYANMMVCCFFDCCFKFCELIVIVNCHLQKHSYEPFKDEAQTALFKGPFRTAL
jgi:hypothetical protein